MWHARLLIVLLKARRKPAFRLFPVSDVPKVLQASRRIAPYASQAVVVAGVVVEKCFGSLPTQVLFLAGGAALRSVVRQLPGADRPEMRLTSQPNTSGVPSDGTVASRPRFTRGGLLPRIEPGASLARHKWLALFLFLLISLGGLPIAQFKGMPSYYTQSALYISPRLVQSTRGGEEFQPQTSPQYREDVQRDVDAFHRVDVAEEALRRVGEKGRQRWRRPKESDRRAAERLTDALIVAPVPESYLVNVGLRGDRPEGLAETLNALLDVYAGVHKSEEFNSVESRLAALRQEADSLGKELVDSQARRAQLAQELGVSTFAENHVNPYEQSAASARLALAEASRQRIIAVERFAIVDPSRGDAARQALDFFALELARKDPANAALLSGTGTRRAALSANLSRLSPDSPERKGVQRELAEADAAVQRDKARLSSAYSRTILEQRRAQLLHAERTGKTLEAELAQREARASSFDRKYREGIGLGQGIEQARKRQASLEERKKALDLESKAPRFVRVLADAQPAGILAKDERMKLALIFVLAGFAIALFVPVAIDILHPAVSVPADAGRALGFDPLGWLPERKEGGEEFTWALVLQLAHLMDQERQSHGTRIWMFTSVKAGGGTTTLVNSLGRALTVLGVPSLAVEANACRSDGRYARNPAGLGLSDLLRGRSTLSQSIGTGNEEMPDHIPVGELDGAGHLPDIHRLGRILDDAAESYALVLVDLPPVLDSVEAQHLARRAGCVVLVVEARRVTARALKRAARVLEGARTTTPACIVNRVHAADAGGFAQDARREFEAGATEPMPGLQQPFLWT